MDDVTEDAGIGSARSGGECSEFLGSGHRLHGWKIVS
jgi:hypothetical protein